MNFSSSDQWWIQRRNQFFKETSYYWKYVFQNLSSGFLFFLIVAGFYGYTRWVESLPETFPYYWLTVPLLTWAVAHSPIRTFLREADKVFLLPVEQQMGAYFTKAILYSLIRQSIVVLLIFFLLWPLYAHLEPERAPVWVYLIFLVLGKWANLMGSWQESQTHYDSPRHWALVLRILANAFILFLMYTNDLWIACLSALLAVAVAWFGYSRIPRHYIHWDYLVQQEKQHRQKHYLFFSWFIEVDKLPTRVKPRRWAAGIPSRLSLKPANTYLYLFSKTYLRSETASISLRLLLVSIFLMIVVSDDWVKALCYLVPLWLGGVQLSSLQQIHRYRFWLQIYPLDGAEKNRAVRQLTLAVLLLHALLNGALLLWLSASWLYPLASIGFALLLIVLYVHVYLTKKLK
ncbi:ABC transporter permease [Paenibacillus senegalensis]|uniref:ABC transporter permease n=1 Tax=Paenibacillus senegalensis TaxID=1465766 RepID=UPI000287E64B|nr:ABC transporter permease [Paenibacillus senegalensis]